MKEIIVAMLFKKDTFFQKVAKNFKFDMNGTSVTVKTMNFDRYSNKNTINKRINENKALLVWEYDYGILKYLEKERSNITAKIIIMKPEQKEMNKIVKARDNSIPFTFKTNMEYIMGTIEKNLYIPNFKEVYCLRNDEIIKVRKDVNKIAKCFYIKEAVNLPTNIFDSYNFETEETLKKCLATKILEEQNNIIKQQRELDKKILLLKERGVL